MGYCLIRLEGRVLVRRWAKRSRPCVLLFFSVFFYFFTLLFLNLTSGRAVRVASDLRLNTPFCLFFSFFFLKIRRLWYTVSFGFYLQCRAFAVHSWHKHTISSPIATHWYFSRLTTSLWGSTYRLKHLALDTLHKHTLSTYQPYSYMHYQTAPYCIFSGFYWAPLRASMLCCGAVVSHIV